MSSKVIFFACFFPFVLWIYFLTFFHSALFSFLFFFLMKLVLFIRLGLNSLAQLVLLSWSDGAYVYIIMVGSVNIFLLLYRNNIFFRYVWFLCLKVKCSGFFVLFYAGFVLTLPFGGLRHCFQLITGRLILMYECPALVSLFFFLPFYNF